MICIRGGGEVDFLGGLPCPLYRSIGEIGIDPQCDFSDILERLIRRK